MAIDNVGSIEYDARITTDKLRKDATEVDRLAKHAGDSVGSHSEKGAHRAGQAFQKFSNIAKVALVATAGAAVAFGVSSVKAFMESQNAIAQTEAVLKSTGGQAGVTSKAITDMANSLQKQTRYSDETIRSAQNMLLTFTNIGNKTFPGATEAVLDMATAMGSDLQSTAVLVGKALQDPVRGATALTRVGVRLSDSQINLIKKFTGAGKAAEAQAIILKELQVEFGGSAKAAGKTFGGQLDILKNQLGEVQESIGSAIVGGLTPLASKFASFVATDQFQAWMTNLTKWLEVNLPLAADWVMNTMLPELKKGFDAVWPGIKTTLDWAGQLFSFLVDHEPILWGIVAVFGAIRTAMFLNGALKTFQEVMGGARLAYSGLSTLVSSPLIMPALGIAAALASIWMVIKAIESIKDAWDQVNKNFDRSAKFDTGEAKRLSALATEARKRGDTKGAAAIAAQIRALGTNAMGTDNWRGGPTWVGERGPEIVNLPRGSQVIPNHEISDRMGGSNVTVNVTMSGIMSRSKSDERDIAKSLIRVVNQELVAKHIAPIGGGAL